MNQSRKYYFIKNLTYGYFSNIIMLILNFVSRTVFINTLGINYLGLSGLFTNVLGVLSFAELGIGTALNYSLYKPVAEGNKAEIKSVMRLYRNSYIIIAAVVATIGILLYPFLKYIVKDPGDVGNVNLYYLIFLFNTVSTYFVSYKYSLVNAEQKNYIMTNINLIVNVIVLIIEIIVLYVTKSYLIYLISIALFGLFQKIFINKYFNKLYPYLLEKDVEPLEKEKVESIKKNVFGLIWHKFGEIATHQTDNIIISSCINVVAVGLVSNYNMIINKVMIFVGSIFTTSLPSIGNLVATSTIESVYSVFRKYRFLSMWLYGFISIIFFTLCSPFITLWIGADKLIDDFSLLLICLNYYFAGQRVAFLNFKTGFGRFYDDKYIPLIAAFINLILSVILCRIMGLPGVYIGTLVSGLFQSVSRPIIAYRKIFKKSVIYYFIDILKEFLVVFCIGLVCYFLRSFIFSNTTWLNFVLYSVTCVVLINGILLLLYFRTEEFKYYYRFFKNTIKKIGVRKNEQ